MIRNIEKPNSEREAGSSFLNIIKWESSGQCSLVMVCLANMFTVEMDATDYYRRCQNPLKVISLYHPALIKNNFLIIIRCSFLRVNKKIRLIWTSHSTWWLSFSKEISICTLCSFEILVNVSPSPDFDHVRGTNKSSKPMTPKARFRTDIIMTRWAGSDFTDVTLYY